MSAAKARVRDRWRFPHWGQRGTAGAAIPAELAFEDVAQAYGALRALDGVSLTIAPGELVCLLGPFGLRQDDAAAGRGGRGEPGRRAGAARRP